MKTERLPEKLLLRTWTLVFGCLSLLFMACDSTAVYEVDEPIDVLRSIELIESIEMTPLPAKNEFEPIEYLLKATLRKVDHIKYPDVINLLGFSVDSPSSLIYDDGSGSDELAGDLVYTGVVTKACSPIDIPHDAAAKKITISCSVSFILPGQECEGHGVCPGSVSRSFLWGLIEYDTSVAVCWCGIECSVEFSLG